MSEDADDLTADWPDEPGAEALARFAGELCSGLAALPDAAVERVGRRVRREIAARRRRRWARMAALAAAVLLAIGLGWHFFSRPAGGPAPAPPEASGRVDDHYTVDFTGPQAAATPSRPPLRLQDNQSLFTN